MSITSFVSSRHYKNFMSKLYGWGASVVIIGALFKIVHIQYANEMLFVGLITESIIFFFSAFEPPHVEPDWSLVYPELSGMYRGGKPGTPGTIKRTPGGKTITQELDDMLAKAKIGPELVQSLGDGMRKMSENVGKMADVSSTAEAADEFVKNVSDASKSAGVLSTSYKKVNDVLQQDANTVGEFSDSIKSAAASAGILATTYNDVSSVIKNEMSATETFSSSLSTATDSANRLAERYDKSAEMLTKSAEMLSFTTLDSKEYNDQLQKISSNLAALNSIYEIQLKSTQQQVDSSTKLQTTVGNFLTNMNESSAYMLKYQQEIDMLTKRVSALNQVYGNMLTAMNVNLNK